MNTYLEKDSNSLRILSSAAARTKKYSLVGAQRGFAQKRSSRRFNKKLLRQFSEENREKRIFKENRAKKKVSYDHRRCNKTIVETQRLYEESEDYWDFWVYDDYLYSDDDYWIFDRYDDYVYYDDRDGFNDFFDPFSW